MSSFEKFTEANAEQLVKNKEKREKERKDVAIKETVGDAEESVSNMPEVQKIIDNAAESAVTSKRKKTESDWKHRNEVNELKEYAKTDPLTELSNRRGFDEYISKKQIAIQKEEIAFAHREKSLALERREKLFDIFIIDLDKFKDVNDTYGHLAGDEVLKKTARIIESQLRSSRDIVARFGGEEFIVAVERDGGNLVKIAERIRESIQKSYIEHDGNEISVTASIGVAPYGANVNDMLDVADKALYIAKGEMDKIEKEDLAIDGNVPTQAESRNQVWYFDNSSEKYTKYEKSDTDDGSQAMSDVELKKVA
ncbi:MAG: GGDEF domain-containing protein [Patescibacteria group bacterium]|nr:GGDEF domain-containing protein [Patescibacteria group bacterium]